MNEILKDLDDQLKKEFPNAREGVLGAPRPVSSTVRYDGSTGSTSTRIAPPEVDTRPTHAAMIDQTIADLQMTIRILETAKKRL